MKTIKKTILVFLIFTSGNANAGTNAPTYLGNADYCTAGYIKSLSIDGNMTDGKYYPNAVVEVDQTGFNGKTGSYYIWFAMDQNKNQVQRWDGIVQPLLRAFERRIPVKLGQIKVNSPSDWNIDCNSENTFPIYAPVALVKLCSNANSC